jgi:flagellar M-ring protein FliF
MLLGILMAVALSISGYMISKTDYSVLYSDLDTKEAGEIMNSLGEMGVKAKISSDNTISVDKRKEDAARMQLAVQGYPKTGLNYDLYMDSITFTTSSQDKKVMLIYQLQERLSKTISMLEGINGAIVTISMENDNVFRFNKDENPVSANVVLDIDRNTKLNEGKIDAIKRLMLTSITGLKEENLAIIDSNLNSLLSSSGIDGGIYDTKNIMALESEVEKNLADKILFMFEPVFGSENIKVAVNASIDLDKKFTEVIEYSPVIEDEGIPYMIDELTEKMNEASQNSGDVAANYQIESESLNSRMQRVVNYRVNELRQTIQEAQGGVKDISVSVLINSSINADESVLENVRQIAATAVGIQDDKITVGYMNFSASEALRADIQSSLSQNSRFQLPISERALFSIVALVFSMIMAMLILRQFKPARIPLKDKKSQIIDVENENLFIKEEEAKSKKEEILKRLNKINEEEKIIKDIESIIDSNPSNIANIISAWLSEDGI